jgi:hypothetical protein
MHVRLLLWSAHLLWTGAHLPWWRQRTCANLLWVRSTSHCVLPHVILLELQYLVQYKFVWVEDWHGPRVLGFLRGPSFEVSPCLYFWRETLPDHCTKHIRWERIVVRCRYDSRVLFKQSSSVAQLLVLGHGLRLSEVCLLIGHGTRCLLPKIHILWSTHGWIAGHHRSLHSQKRLIGVHHHIGLVGSRLSSRKSTTRHGGALPHVGQPTLQHGAELAVGDLEQLLLHSKRHLWWHHGHSCLLV